MIEIIPFEEGNIIGLRLNGRIEDEEFDEMVMKLTGVNEAYADTFMIWFNGQNVLPYTASEYQVRDAIIEYYEVFKFDYDLK